MSSQDFPTHFVLSRAMPIILQTMSNTKSSKGTPLKMMAKLLAAAAAESRLIPEDPNSPWYDNFVHQVNTELDSEEGCLAMASACPFLRDQNATDIFEHIIKQCL